MLTSDIVNEHAPVKKRIPRANPVPFMNSVYRKACFSKAMAHNKFFRWGRTNKQWELFRKCRNEAANIRAKSIKKYFDERCNEQYKSNPKKYWDTIKPFISDKAKSGPSSFILKINDNIVNDPFKISNEFNSFFSTVASNIGKSDKLIDRDNVREIVCSYENHSSIREIKQRLPNNSSFAFKKTTETDVLALLRNIDPKKSAGYDGIPPKMLKIAAKEFSLPLTCIINDSITLSNFPSQLKRAEVSPLYKKSDTLITGNYRPVSVLSCVSKMFEKTYYDQMYSYFMNILSVYLSAFRKRYGCHHVLLKMLEDWKLALENGEHVGCILMDLSKAFDCLPHKLLISKLHAYGMTDSACELIRQYLQCRQQRVKVGTTRSDWCYLSKGVPQGSILGPLLFNIFINDIFYSLEMLCKLYNYADDNKLSHSTKNMSELKCHLEHCADVSIKWFDVNELETNPTKFQGTILTRGYAIPPETFTINDINIPVDKNVIILGVNFDNKVKFDKHVSEICKKA